MAQLFTQALFWEARNERHPDICEYTTKHSDRIEKGKTYFSMYREYLRIGDPTEFEFVDQIFNGNWRQWQAVQSSEALKTLGLDTDTWSVALEMQIKSKALKTVINDAGNPSSKTAASSAKWIAEGKYKDVVVIPSRAKKAQEKTTKLEGEVADEVQDDMKRLGLQ